MDQIAVQRTQKAVVKSSTFYLDSGRQANGLEIGKQESGEERRSSWSGTEGWIELPGSRRSRRSREAGKQGSREAGKQGIRDRRGRYREGRQENAGKTFMAKNNLAKE